MILDVLHLQSSVHNSVDITVDNFVDSAHLDGNIEQPSSYDSSTSRAAVSCASLADPGRVSRETFSVLAHDHFLRKTAVFREIWTISLPFDIPISLVRASLLDRPECGAHHGILASANDCGYVRSHTLRLNLCAVEKPVDIVCGEPVRKYAEHEYGKCHSGPWASAVTSWLELNCRVSANTGRVPAYDVGG